jgi:hypothetical protein
MNKRKPYRIEAFTILEALIVLALMSILTAFFFTTLNRLGDQMKNDVKIKSELNSWFLIRSNLYREFDEVDSVSTRKDNATLFFKNKTVNYSIKDQLLNREENGNVMNLAIEMNGIELTRENRTVFHFNWKGEDMALGFSADKNLKDRINHYFSTQPWE